MPAQLIDGKAIATKVKHHIRAQVDLMLGRGLRRPGLAVVMLQGGGRSVGNVLRRDVPQHRL